MKGPRSRHRFNVLRVWECPRCMKRIFAPPQVVTRACLCQVNGQPTWMCLIEAMRGAKPPGAAASVEA